MKRKKNDYFLSYFMLHQKYLDKYDLRFCNRFLKRHPSCTEAYRDRGHIYMRMKRHSQAIKDFTKVLQLSSGCYSYSIRSDAYAASGQFQKAVVDLSKAIDLRKEGDGREVFRISELYGKRAELYLKLKKYKRAINDFKNAIKISGNNASCYYNLADIYSSCKNPKVRNGIKAVYYAKKANAEYRRYVRKGPKQLPYYYLEILAASYAQVGNFKEAVRVQKKIIPMVKRYKHLMKSHKSFLKERERRLSLYKQRIPFYELLQRFEIN